MEKISEELFLKLSKCNFVSFLEISGVLTDA